MRAMVGAGLLCVVWLALATMADGGPIDGNSWTVMSQDERDSWAIGFLSGVSVEDARIKFMLTAVDMPSCKTDSCIGAIAEYSNSVQHTIEENERRYKKVSPRQIADGISHLYSDYRNRRIDTINAAFVAMDAINGSTNERIEKGLELLRKKAGEN